MYLKGATLAEEGLKQKTCKVCGDIQEEKIDKIGTNENIVFVTENEIIADNITLGMTQREVMSVLGDPDETSDGVWYWYEDSFAKKYAKANELLQSSKESDWVKGAEMMDELLEMTFECTMIKFDSSTKTVEEYFYDANHKYSSDSDYESANKKELKTLKIANFDSIDYYESDVENCNKVNFDLENKKIIYLSEFKDGSKYVNVKSLFKASMITEQVAEISFKDEIFSYSFNINAKKNWIC